MADARRREAWSHTSAVMAWVGNVMRDPKKTRPFSPDDFNPFAKRRRRPLRGLPIRADNIEDLKVFIR